MAWVGLKEDHASMLWRSVKGRPDGSGVSTPQHRESGPAMASHTSVSYPRLPCDVIDLVCKGGLSDLILVLCKCSSLK